MASKLEEVKNSSCKHRTDLAYSRDSRHLAITSDNTAHILTYKKEDATWFKCTFEYHKRFGYTPCFSPDSCSLVISSADMRAFIFDFCMGEWNKILDVPAELSSSRYSHNSRYLATYILRPDDKGEWESSLCTLFSRDEQRNLLQNTQKSYSDVIKKFCFSPNDQFLLTMLKRHVEIQDLDDLNSKPQHFIVVGTDDFHNGLFTPNSHTLVTTFNKGKPTNIYVYSEEKKLWELNHCVNSFTGIKHIKFSHDSQTMLITTLFDCTARIFVSDKSCWKKQSSIPNTHDRLSSTGFSNSGRYLVLDLEDKLNSLIFTRNNVGNWVEKQRIKHSDTIASIRFSRNDRHLVATSDNKISTIYTLSDEALFVESAQIAHHCDGYGHPPEFYPDCQRLLTAKDNIARILAVDETGHWKDLQDLPHKGTVKYARLSPDGSTVATVTRDHTLHIFMEDAST
ncbi:WD40 repeat domain-containing protein [Endozoicomonas sp.]|uniref:WD40 repeat domain-containing protein n=1 Tax=Endozoicomonas sp. TaxID=1892382 RepID=UPI00383B9D4E